MIICHAQGWIFSLSVKAFTVTKVTVNGKDPINFLKFEEYQESTSEYPSIGTISPPVHRPWPGVTRRRQWVSALLIPLIDGRVTINY